MTNDRYVFTIRKQAVKAGSLYHFKGCGLPNVYLAGGVKIENDPDYGETVSIERLPELFLAIAIRLIAKKAPLTGPEYRFLRKRMDMTQAELAKELRVDEQTVANYEKGKTEKAGPADIAVRLIFASRFVKSDELAIELRLRAEDLMDAARGKRDKALQAGPWIASCNG